MQKYLLDTNVVIELWKSNINILDELISNNKIVILREILKELAVKEKRKYRENYILTERFCALLPFEIEMDKVGINEFNDFLESKLKDNINYNKNNLSQNDLLQLYTCYLNKDYILVTKDKSLFNIAPIILQENNIISFEEVVSNYNL